MNLGRQGSKLYAKGSFSPVRSPSVARDSGSKSSVVESSWHVSRRIFGASVNTVSSNQAILVVSKPSIQTQHVGNFDEVVA